MKCGRKERKKEGITTTTTATGGWDSCRYSDMLQAVRFGNRIPVEGEIFCTCPDLPWAHPPSYTLVSGSFLGVKRPGRGIDHLSHLALRLKKE